MSKEESDKDAHGDPAAAVIALSAAHDPAFAKDARHYLRVQSALAQVQAEELKEERRLRHWSLRVRHVSDVMRLSFELALAIIFSIVALCIGVAVWDAAHDKALVIEAFSLPPDLAARGLTGQAVAARLLDKLQAMQDATDSARPADSYTNNWGDDIKVQIPDTGVSLGEVRKLLVTWLGHETHISGEVWRTASGLAVTARVNGQGGGTAVGSEGDFDKLLQQAAEKVYERTQPYRYAVYIGNLGRHSQAAAVYARMIADEDSARERAWAYLGLGLAENFRGQTSLSTRYERLALAQDPDLALAYIDIVGNELTLGHDEAALLAAQHAVAMLENGGNVDMSERARTISLPTMRVAAESLAGDFQAARAADEEVTRLPDYSGDVEKAREDIAAQDAEMHDGEAARRAWASLPPERSELDSGNRAVGKFVMSYWLGDWQALPAEDEGIERIIVAILKKPEFADLSLSALHERQLWPFEAQAFAMTGDFKGAHALIDKTPTDCFDCLRIRGGIDAAEKNWGGAEYWFARAVKAAPSIPLGYSDWGRMLLATGDYDDAIAKFAAAHDKGPHFADPLEMWGEALIAKNRSDLALEKFQEANLYAPNWGRLHLKWGEALLWSGDKADAAKQFAVAARLDLTSSERSGLSRMRMIHV